ncbi:MAG: hypothetical protein F4114_04390 [Rhodospirillaceae bacterium]|nr:hypothetical protein [Rhodospirillaceae bacterium]MXW91492.1 hypothetical protein [Rhodospirillaceae bacterium]MYB14822.1 hypothetical protein [Rhodospirillaceae bacterium]MYI48311.1 hypothetical protein [Rhodospirillaceae bacterium]
METTATEIEAALDELPGLPAWVSGWQVETGLDWVDDPAVWVWVLLEDEEVEAAALDRLQEVIRDRVRLLTGPAVWAYVRFRGASEMAQLA